MGKSNKSWGGIGSCSIDEADLVYERVVKKIGPEPTSGNHCWVWRGAMPSSPIMRLAHDGRSFNIRRAFWIRWYRRTVPKYFYPRPKCGTLGCLRKEHLELGDLREIRKVATASSSRNRLRRTAKLRRAAKAVRPPPQPDACPDCGVPLRECGTPRDCAERVSQRLRAIADRTEGALHHAKAV